METIFFLPASILNLTRSPGFRPFSKSKDSTAYPIPMGIAFMNPLISQVWVLDPDRLRQGNAIIG